MLEIESKRLTGTALKGILNALMFGETAVKPEHVHQLWSHLLWIEDNFEVPDEEKASLRLNMLWKK